MSAHILIVTPLATLAGELIETLQWGYRTSWVKYPDDALAASASECDLLIVDLSLGRDVVIPFVKCVRREGDVPILATWDSDRTEPRIAVLRAGADGFLPPTLIMEELLVRIAAQLRRPVLRRVGPIAVGALAIDLDARTCTVRDDEVKLTRVEFDLLAELVLRRGATVSRHWLATHVLRDRLKSAERNLDAHISHLRRKLGPAGTMLETVRGAGFRFRLGPTRQPLRPRGRPVKTRTA